MTRPVKDLAGPLLVPTWFAAVARTISATSTTVNTDAAIQKRPAGILHVTYALWGHILLAPDIKTAQPG
jgi:hypothetical protein